MSGIIDPAMTLSRGPRLRREGREFHGGAPARLEGLAVLARMSLPNQTCAASPARAVPTPAPDPGEELRKLVRCLPVGVVSHDFIPAQTFRGCAYRSQPSASQWSWCSSIAPSAFLHEPRARAYSSLTVG